MHTGACENRTNPLKIVLFQSRRKLGAQNADLVIETNILVKDRDIGVPLMLEWHILVSRIKTAQCDVNKRILLLRCRASYHATAHICLQDLLEKAFVHLLKNLTIILNKGHQKTWAVD